MNGLFKQVSLWIVLGIIVVLVLTRFSDLNPKPAMKGQADFVEQMLANNIADPVKVSIGETSVRVYAKFKEPVGEAKQTDFTFTVPEFRPEWEATLDAQKVKVDFSEENNMFINMVFQIVLLLLIIGAFWFFMIRQMQGGNNKAMSFGKSRARMVNQGDKTVTFNDVAGVDEAKEELHEIIEFLKCHNFSLVQVSNSIADQNARNGILLPGCILPLRGADFIGHPAGRQQAHRIAHGK